MRKLSFRDRILSLLTIEDAIFNQEKTAFVLETADRANNLMHIYRRADLDDLGMFAHIKELEYEALNYAEKMQTQTPLLQAQDQAIEQEINFLREK